MRRFAPPSPVMSFLNRLFSKSSSGEPAHLPQIVREMLAAPTNASLKRIFDRYPEIVSDDFLNLLKRWIPAQTDPRAVQLLTQFQNLATVCRQHGVEAVFSGLAKSYSMADYEMEIPALLDEAFEQLADLVQEAHRNPSLNQRRIELIDALLNRIPAGPFELFRASLLNERGLAYQALQGTDRQANQRKAMESYREALRYNNPEKAPSQYAMIHSNLGTAFVNFREGDLAMNLRQAVEHYGEALRVFTPEKTPLDFARMQINLGSVHLRLPSGERLSNLREAISSFEQALIYLTPENAPLEFAKTNCYLATAYINLPALDRAENLQRALACIQKAQTILTPESTPYDHAMSELLLGEIQAEWNSVDLISHLDEAFKHLQKAMSFFASDAYPFEWATIQEYLGVAHSRRNTGNSVQNIQRAIECFRNALTVHTRDATPWNYAQTRNNLGSSLVALPSADRSANLREAIECFETALLVFTPESDPSQYAATQNNLGNAHYQMTTGDRLANLQKAIACYEEALRFRSLESNPWEYAGTQINLGIAYRNLPAGDRAANLHQAIACYEAALAVYTPERAPGYHARVQNNIGIVYENLSTGDREANLQRAIAAYEQALRFRTAEAAPDEYAETNHNLGNAYSRIFTGVRQQMLQRAIACYREALRFWTETTQPMDFAALQLNLANAYAALTPAIDPDGKVKAIECIREAMKIYNAETSPLRYAHALDHLGWVYSRMTGPDNDGNRRQAIHAYEEALRYSPVEVMPGDRGSTALRLGDLHFEVQAWEDAHAAYDAAIAAGEMLYHAAATGISRMLELETSGDLFAKDAFCLARLGRYTEAVERLEAGRARALAEALSRDHAALDDAHAADQEDFRRACDLLKTFEVEARSLSASGRDQRRVRSFLELSNDIKRTRLDLDAVIERIRTYRPDFMPDALSLAAIARAVAPDAPLIYLIVTEHGSMAMFVLAATEALDQRHILWLDDFRVEDLQNLLVRRNDAGQATGGYLIGQIGNDPAGFHRSLTETLSVLRDCVGRRLEDHAAGFGFNRAVLITGGLLALLPVHAAFERLAVAYVPSGRLLQTVRRIVANQPERAPILFAVGNPLPNPQPLAFARAEVEAIAKMFTHPESLAVYEQDATHSRFQQRLPTATYLHFACHGAFDLDEPLLSSLALSGDDRLTLRELLDGGLNLSNSRLAVLSACQTGITAFEHVPDEVIGLPAGFLQAGVPAAIATLWPVSDVSTMLLMAKFYEYHLNDALVPAVALRKAQFWLRAATNEELAELFDVYRKVSPGSALQKTSQEQFLNYAVRDPKETPFAHPYYWAAFALHGD